MTTLSPWPRGPAPAVLDPAPSPALDGPCDTPCARARVLAPTLVEPHAGASERLALAVARYLAAATATGETDCLDAAFAEAEAVLPAERAGLLVGALGALLRAFAAQHGRPLATLPASCCRATRDEETLVAAIVAARRTAHPVDRVGRAAASVAALLDAPLDGRLA